MCYSIYITEEGAILMKMTTLKKTNGSCYLFTFARFYAGCYCGTEKT